MFPAAPNIYKSKKDAQDAHEAVRPTSAMRTPDDMAPFLAEDQLKLYRLIWMRFIASQMNPAVFDQTTIDLNVKGKGGTEYTFRATGSVMKFDGFLAVYEEGKDQKDEEDDELKHKLPGRYRGRRAEAARPEAGAAFHRAAAALQRSHAGEETGSGWRGPPVHLRFDSFHHSGTRVRDQRRRQVQAHRAGHGGDGPAARKLQRYLRRALYGAHGRGARRNRRRQARLARGHGRVSTSGS